RHHRTKLNVFQFLESPYTLRRDMVFVDAEKTQIAHVTPDLIAKKDRELRESYDERLGDYIDVGFRLCEGNDEFELRKCFRKGDYEILVIGYHGKGTPFGGTTTIDEFAAKFKAPVVLVGPEAPDCFHLNQAARERLADLMIPEGKWQMVS
ncbi:MAG: universal stress protein, partial [Deltaproteobacteria bacterium]|nr:universal stress protein [Deltaproteobacteria bacterium]